MTTRAAPSFGESLRNIRKNCKLTQHDVRARIGISEDTLRKIENGFVMPKLETLMLLSEVYKFDVIQLLNDHNRESTWIDIDLKLDKALYNEDLKTVDDLIENLQISMTCHSKDLLIPRNARQYLYFLKDYRALLRGDYDEQLQNSLIRGLRLTIPGFSINSLKDHYYNRLELRFLQCIAISYYRCHEYQTALHLLEVAYDELNSNTYPDQGTIHAITTNCLYLTLCNAALNQYSKAALWAETGIQHCAKEMSSYLLCELHYQKGIMSHSLNRPDFLAQIVHAINIAYLTGKPECAESFRTKALQNHNIPIPTHLLLTP